MKKALIYSAMVLLAGAMACSKNDHVLSGEGRILFAPADAGTRALVTNDNITGEKFQVFDFMGTTKYIDETISYDTATSTWAYASGDDYLWKAGTHKLFGFTAGAGTLDENQKVTFTKTLTTATEDQVDLLYSEIVTQDAAAWKAIAGNTPDTPVALNFKHTLAAVSVTLKNYTDFEASVTKVTAPAIPNAGSATVDFSGTAPAVTYGAVSTSGSFVAATPISTATALASGKTIDVLAMAAADAKGYQMVWPQTLPDGENAVTVTVSYSLNGATFADKTVTLPADTWVAGQKYDYELQILPSDIRLVFKVQPWESGEAGDIDTEDGSINMSNVTWMNTKLYVNDELVNTVVNSAYSVYMYKDPYLATASKYTEDVYQTYAEDVKDPDTGEVIHHAGDQVLDEEDNPILLHKEGDLVLDENGHQVYQKGAQYSGYYPAQGYFTVNYPKAGLFKIDLIPAVGETTVDASKYEILIYDNTIANPEAPQDEQHPVGFRAIDPDGETITNNTVYFRVAAAAEQDGAQHKAQIDIWFKPSGSDEWISAYSEVRANYACVIPATN